MVRKDLTQFEVKDVLDWVWASGFQAAQTEAQIQSQAPVSGVVNMAELRAGLEKMLAGLTVFRGNGNGEREAQVIG